MVLPESVLEQNGPKWSFWPVWSKLPYSEPDASIRETKMDQNGPFWPEEVHFGPPTASASWFETPVNGDSGRNTNMHGKRPHVTLSQGDFCPNQIDTGLTSSADEVQSWDPMAEDEQTNNF